MISRPHWAAEEDLSSLSKAVRCVLAVLFVLQHADRPLRRAGCSLSSPCTRHRLEESEPVVRRWEGDLLLSSSCIGPS